MTGFLSTFTNTVWKVVSIVIIIIVFILLSWYLYKRKKDPASVLKEATGVITNPASSIDKTRSAKLKDALAVIWKD